MGPTGSASARVLAALAALMALVSFGPQKYADPQFALIWPAVISGQIAAISVLVRVFPRSRSFTHKGAA